MASLPISSHDTETAEAHEGASEHMISRRALLLGGLGAVALAAAGGYAGVEEGVLPGRIRLAQLTGQCDVDAAPLPGDALIESGSFASSKRNCVVGWSIATPATSASTRVAVVLHGRGCDHTTAFANLKLHDFLVAAVKAGTPPFALASVDGGDDTYWHPRKSGDDPIAMLTDEFLPILASRGFDTGRIATLGWSMGGYGSLLLARESHRKSLKNTEVVAAAAGSPALFTSFKASADGAFDDAADFARYGALAENPDVGGTPLFVSCGRDDAFTDETKRYRANVDPTPAGGVGKGCHTDGYWRSIATQQLAFIGARLAQD